MKPFKQWIQRKWGVARGCMLLVLLTGSLVFGQEAGGKNTALDRPLRTLWQDYKQAKETQDLGLIADAFHAIRNRKLSLGAIADERAALLFLHEGFAEMERGNYDVANREFVNAIETNPFLWSGYYGLAQVKKNRDGDFLKVFSLYFKGFFSAVDGRNVFFLFDYSVWLLDHLLRCARMAFFVIALLLCVPYSRPAYVTFTKRFRNMNLHPTMVHVLATALMMLPLLLGFNPLLAFSLYLVLFFPFFKKGQRIATCLVLFFSLFIAPFFAYFQENAALARSNAAFRLRQAQFYPGDLSKALALVDELIAANHADDTIYLLQSNFLRLSGDKNGAILALDKISDSSDLWAEASVNKGNLYYMAGDYPKAIAHYEQALGRNAKLAQAFFNQSVVQGFLGNTVEANTLKEQGSQLDTELYKRWMQREDLSTVFFLNPPKSAGFFRILLTGLPGSPGAALKNPQVYLPLILAFVVLIAGFVHAAVRSSFFLGLVCQKCGLIFFQTDSPNSQWCSQCVNIYQRNTDMPNEAKAKKKVQVYRFSVRKRLFFIVVQILFPGSAQLIQGQAVLGCLLLFFWIGLLMFGTATVGAMAVPETAVMTGLTMGNYLILILVFLFWGLFGLLPALRQD